VVARDCISTFPLARCEAETFGIAELCKEFGVTARALRFYEEEGLVSPRREGAVRVYSRRDRARLVWILRGRSLGFSLDEIGELLDLYDLGDGRVQQRAMTVRRCREHAERLRHELDEIRDRIEQLTAFADRLEQGR